MSPPPDSVLGWVAGRLGRGATVEQVTGLRSGGKPWLLRLSGGGAPPPVILKASFEDRSELATEAAALSLAEARGLSTPRLLAADLSGEEAGMPAIVFTVLEGSSQVPKSADSARLRGLGAAAAAVHGCALSPTSELPPRDRHMPWIDFSSERVAGHAESTALLGEADAALRALATPQEQTVFVHGDLWHGNTMWRDNACVGIIDWEAAGAGSYGVDLGSLRWDAALLYGSDAPDEVLRGWEEAAGRSADNVAYWDLVAGLNTPADMTPMVPSMTEAGRPDLDGASLTTRRDDFVRTALRRSP